MKRVPKGRIFLEDKTNRVKKNVFNLSHDRKFSCDFGELIPIMVMDVVPGDSVQIKPSAHIKFAPLITPVMSNFNQTLHYFFVPNRITWPDFEKFITGGEDGLDETVWANTDYNPAIFQAGTLPDYLGLPIATDTVNGAGEAIRVSTLPFAAYNKIYNDYYRDENLIQPIPDQVPSGEMSIGDFMNFSRLKNRAWRKDYLTSALPWTQKGPESLLPLGGEADIVYRSQTNPAVKAWIAGQSPTAPTLSDNISTGANANEVNSATDGPLAFDISDSHYTDLSTATQVSINDLRRAFALQSWLEKNARGGSRYNEFVQVHFGTFTGDARVDRAEYIGGVKTPIKISEVLQTSMAPNQTTPQGNMAGHGVSVGSGQSFRYNVKEHGYIIGIMSVLPEAAYQQGIPRHYLRNDKFEYYFPSFAHIGEQAISNTELAISGNSSWNKGTFGYTPRYSEYKFMQSTVHGDFKTNLDYWHAGRKFGNEPLLNEAFVTMSAVDTKRIFAVENGDVDKLWCHVYNDVMAARPMPIYGTPKII